MTCDVNSSKELQNIKEFILIDTDNDRDLFENIFKCLSNLINIHLDFNRITFISENFVNQIKYLNSLSLSDNATLIVRHLLINRLDIHKSFQELIINICGIEQTKLPNQVEGKVRRRRQYLYNNYGSYALNPAVASYYDTNTADIYNNNAQQNNRFIVGGVAYQYPTPVNVMSGGSYNPQQYNAYPSGSGAYYYANMNNMRLPSPDGWYSAYYFQGYPFLPIFNSAQRHANMSLITKLFFM
ncbi:unnamed protein product, partial [Rotaria sp. Silwood1]